MGGMSNDEFYKSYFGVGTLPLEEAIAILKAYQVWSKSPPNVMTKPLYVNQAIDVVIEAAEELASMVSE